MAWFRGASLIFLVLTCWHLVLEASANNHIPLTLGVETSQQQVTCDEFLYFEVETTDFCRDLRIQVNSAEGDPDLFVSKAPNRFPTFTSLMWTSYEIGGENLTIFSWDPEYVIGTYYIGVINYCQSTTNSSDNVGSFTILAETVDTTQAIYPNTDIPPVIPQNGQVQGTLLAQDYVYYRFCLPSSCVNLTLTLSNCDDYDVCPDSYAFPDVILSGTKRRPLVRDYAWKLVEDDATDIRVGHDDPFLYPGHYFVGVYGYCVPDAICDDNTTCGPCSVANNSPYTLSLTVQEISSDDGCRRKGSRWARSGVGQTASSVMSVILALLLFVCIL